MASLKSQSPQPQSLSPSTSGRQPTNNNNNHNNSNNHNNNKNNNNVVCNSPEFEFWMVRNPSCPQPNLLPADQLFFDGIVLPLHLLHHHRSPKPEARPTDPQPGPSSSITDPTPPSLSSSKRWKDIIFRKTSKTKTTPPSSEEDQKPNKEKKKEKKKKPGPTSSSPELNINIWPFSRSRSAGNASNRPKFPGPVSRKVNSAPCSRSNSAGDSKSRKWPTSPGRAGVHVGRSSPVWQARRPKTSSKNPDPVGRRSKISAGAGSKARVLNLNVPMCIGYRDHLSCRNEENDGGAGAGSAESAAVCGVAGDDGVGNAAAGSGGNIFNLRSLFTKKSMVTSH